MSLAVLGQGLVLLALLASIAGAVAGCAGAMRANSQLMVSGRRAAHVCLACASAASALLIAALVSTNYSLRYVQDQVNEELPFGFRLTALWAGQEGSLLLWLTMLAGFTVLFGRDGALRGRRSGAYAHAVLCAVLAFFALLVAVAARPFAVATTEAIDGSGLTPALQNYWMVVHPPALYVGYVGVAVPFAIVIGALLAREPGDSWVRATRRWALIAFAGLTSGLLLGARWAYEEIGWGGYWAWDPVENAALMPWLTLAAFVHSIMVQERRGMMRSWNVVLILLTFGLSIFGTFLTRSGIVSSVHSFVESPVGWYFLGFLALTCAASLTLMWRAGGYLRSRNDLESVVSREATFLFNNLLLVSLAMAVFWGVMFPILTEALATQRVSVQAPYYDFFAVAFGLPLVALMGVGPLVAWRKCEPGQLRRRLRVPLAAAGTAGAVMIIAGLAGSWAATAAVSFSSFVLATTVQEFVRGVRARRQAEPLTRRRAFVQLFERNRRRYGGYLAHAGVGLLVIGVAGSSAYSTTREVTLSPGERANVQGYSLTYTAARRVRSANAMEVRAVFHVQPPAGASFRLLAGKNFYPASQEVSNEVGIRRSWRRGEDLFVSMDRLHPNGTLSAKVLVNPVVNLIWLGGVVIVGGVVIAAWPTRRERPPGTYRDPGEAVLRDQPLDPEGDPAPVPELSAT